MNIMCVARVCECIACNRCAFHFERGNYAFVLCLLPILIIKFSVYKHTQMPHAGFSSFGHDESNRRYNCHCFSVIFLQFVCCSTFLILTKISPWDKCLSLSCVDTHTHTHILRSSLTAFDVGFEIQLDKMKKTRNFLSPPHETSQTNDILEHWRFSRWLRSTSSCKCDKLSSNLNDW